MEEERRQSQEAMRETISNLNAEIEAARQRAEGGGGFWGIVSAATVGFIMGGPVGAVIGAGADAVNDNKSRNDT